MTAHQYNGLLALYLAWFRAGDPVAFLACHGPAAREMLATRFPSLYGR